MKFFEPRPAEGDVEWISYVDSSEGGLALRRLVSARAGDGEQWYEPLVQLVTVGDEGQLLQPVPTPWLGSYTVVFKDFIIDSVGDILGHHGELRSLPCADGSSLIAFIPFWREGFIDLNSSRIDRFPSTGRIARIGWLGLREAAQEFGAFRLKEAGAGSTYFREDVVASLESLGVMVGTQFREIGQISAT